MRLREAVASALHLLVIAIFFGLALFLLFLPSMPSWRLASAAWLLDQPEHFYGFGAIFAGAACLFIFGFYAIGRGRFLRLLIKPHIAIIEPRLLKEAVEDCFRTHFPGLVRGADIAVLSKQQLDVAIDLLPLEEKQQHRLLREMEKQLSYLLKNRFGYIRPFILSVRWR